MNNFNNNATSTNFNTRSNAALRSNSAGPRNGGNNFGGKGGFGTNNLSNSNILTNNFSKNFGKNSRKGATSAGATRPRSASPGIDLPNGKRMKMSNSNKNVLNAANNSLQAKKAAYLRNSREEKVLDAHDTGKNLPPEMEGLEKIDSIDNKEIEDLYNNSSNDPANEPFPTSNNTERALRNEGLAATAEDKDDVIIGRQLGFGNKDQNGDEQSQISQSSIHLNFDLNSNNNATDGEASRQTSNSGPTNYPKTSVASGYNIGQSSDNETVPYAPLSKQALNLRRMQIDPTKEQRHEYPRDMDMRSDISDLRTDGLAGVKVVCRMRPLSHRELEQARECSISINSREVS